MSECDLGLTIGEDRLSNFAENTALSISIDGYVKPEKMADKIRESLKQIKAVNIAANDYASNHSRIPREIEWLLDNWYIAEREGKDALKQIRCSCRLRSAAGATEKTVVSSAAAALIRAGSGEIGAKRIRIFLDAFQNELCFEETELGLFVPILKGELVNALADVCRKIKKKS